MYSADTIVQSGLSSATSLTVYFENYAQKMTIPCITYIESNNLSYVDGDTIRYSTINYTIKLWTRDLADTISKQTLIDNKMKELGFKRSGSNILISEGLICKILNYTALAKEIETITNESIEDNTEEEPADVTEDVEDEVTDEVTDEPADESDEQSENTIE